MFKTDFIIRKQKWLTFLPEIRHDLATMHQGVLLHFWVIFKLAVSTRLHAGRAELLRTEIGLAQMVLIYELHRTT